MRSRPLRPLATLAAGGLAAVLLAGCGGSSGSSAAPDDAKASCAALSRSKDTLAKPDAATIRRLNAAANLGIAASGESKKYANLGAPMNALLSDVQTTNLAKAATDTRAALSVCSDLKLPH